jgi:hypothetical protein
VGVYCNIARIAAFFVASAADKNICGAGLFAVSYCLDAVINIDSSAGLEANFGDCLVSIGHVIGFG